MTPDNAVKIAKERIMLNSLRMDKIQSPIRAEFIRETNEALQVLVDCVVGNQSAGEGWIDILEKLPEYSGVYLTWYISEEYGKGVVIQRFNVLSKLWGMAAMFGGRVSHWRTLPEAPEGGKE